MKYYYGLSNAGDAIQRAGKFISVKRNAMNPIDYGSFVTIAYYETPEREIVGLVY